MCDLKCLSKPGKIGGPQEPHGSQVFHINLVWGADEPHRKPVFNTLLGSPKLIGIYTRSGRLIVLRTRATSCLGYPKAEGSGYMQVFQEGDPSEAALFSFPLFCP